MVTQNDILKNEKMSCSRLEGRRIGCFEGCRDGCFDGCSVGVEEDCSDGEHVGWVVGCPVGTKGSLK